MRTRLGFFITITIAATLTFGQHDKVTVHISKNPRDFVAYCALWRADGEFRSSIRLSNQLLTVDMDAWITLYMADGTAYELPPVHLGKGAVDVVDVSDALTRVPDAVRPHLSTVGSAAVRYRYDWQGAVYATMSILNLVRSLEFAAPFTFPEAAGSASGTPETHIFQGLWWKRGDTANGFLAIANATDKPVQVTVRAGGAPDGIETVLAPHAMSFQRLPELLVHAPSESAHAGGIEISYKGRLGDVQVSGALEDPATGYSRDMPFAPQQPHQEPPAEQRYAAVGLMLGQQQASLGFPSHVRFVPFAFFRNIGPGARRLQLEAYYMEGIRTVGSLPLPPLSLEPGASAEVPLANIASALPNVEAINLAWSYQGHAGDILSGIGSMDQSGTYVFPVTAQAIGRTGSKASIYWEVANGFDTMYTIWNPQPTDEDVLVTLRYGNGSQVYQMPVHLVPHESAMIDIGELAREQRPDFRGKLLPVGPIQGTLLVSGPQNAPDETMNVVVTGGIYNPKKATCGSTCETCNGMTSMCFDPASLLPTPGGTDQGGFCYNNWDGWVYWLTNSADWSSTDTGIATVQTHGSVTPGLTTGVAVGSATINAVSRQDIPLNAGQICAPNRPPCPTARPGSGGPVTVAPQDYTVTASAFIPTNWAIGDTCDGGVDLVYKGDNRSFSATSSSYRTRTIANLRIPGALVNATFATGETRSYASDALANNNYDNTIGPDDEDGIPNDCHLWHQSGTASTADMHATAGGDAGHVTASIYGSAGNPIAWGARPIDWNYSVTIQARKANLAPAYFVTGSHDCYPAHEVWIGNTLAWGFMPTVGLDDRLGIFGCLIGSGSIQVDGRGNLP